jgi:fatty-acid desaturase
MNTLRAIDRVIPDAATSNLLGRIEWTPVLGRIEWTPVQSIWTLANGLLGVVGVVWFFSWGALAVFMVLTVITVCAGHSVGMHRLLIHRSFKTYRAVE